MLNTQHFPLLASIMAFLANQQNGSLTTAGDCDTYSGYKNKYAIGVANTKQKRVNQLR